MKSIFGLNERIVAPIAYFGLCLSGILVYIFEKENRFVRFHALQSTITFGAVAVLSFALKMLQVLLMGLPLVGWLGGTVFGLAIGILDLCSLVLWIYLMYSAWQGKTFKVPVIGDIVWDKVNS